MLTSPSETLYESISNWQTVSYFNRAPFERDRYGKAVQATITAEMTWIFRSFTGHGVQSLIMTFGFAGAAILATSQISSGRKPVGNLVTLIMYWGTMTYPLSTMADSYRQISSTLIDAERLLQLLKTSPTVTDSQMPADLTAKTCKVEFKDVSFSYDKRKDVLRNINFVAEPGKTVAFVGETGGGKSTMLKLLFRFYDVTKGSITIDGQDLRSVTISSLREALGAVPQDPSLFNQTILENVRYARLDATDDEIFEVCKAAAMHDKIMSFPDQYRSKVGERGVKLSGGELQRISIARLLLKNPKIVMLDEATSAVDSSTEALIQDAFKILSAGRTTFVIAHRLSTIIEADLILVVDHGEIIERGPHAELVQQGGKYLELWTKQTVVKSSKADSAHETVDKADLLVDLDENTAGEDTAEPSSDSASSNGPASNRQNGPSEDCSS
jgi:ABC-type transport system involved in Fe-S cluster assembly fused permease/ATPase subunit